MPKQKTHKATKKRFRLTAHGKVLFKHSGTSHRQTRLTQKRKRKLRGTGVLKPPLVPAIRQALNGESY